eukprot:CAMPEP_0194579906 /NCGR_PEP_ID=MMETSP0292-20121207/13849_1 /TAXON_ID=39354 /ORGANISM="Heterosigma akashiwo, Strain CCMP2393" /LENGTH=253 /DNA_ID=CAMNT_0039433079 /DNA_START=40 /DNA_END=801 /DNA_ORIENTATION=-
MAEANPPVVEPDTETADRGRKKRWFPLESNPDVMNSYIEKLGFPTDLLRWTDVFSTEDWALEMVPQPAQAVCMLFPIKDVTEAHKEEERKRIEESGQEVSDNVYYMRQYVGNACGTVALLHAVGNQPGVPLAEGSWLRGFMERTRALSPHDKAVAVENEDELDAAHNDATAAGQSERQALDAQIETHFVCFVHVDGHLYELDGRKAFPINHGPTCPETLLADACRVIQEFMARDEGEVRFTITALAPPAAEEG